MLFYYLCLRLQPTRERAKEKKNRRFSFIKMCIKAAGEGMKKKKKNKVSSLPVPVDLSMQRQLNMKDKQGGLIPAKRKSVKRMMFDRITGFIASVVGVAG